MIMKDRAEARADDVALALGIFGVAAVIIQATSNLMIQLLSAFVLALSYLAVMELTRAFVLPRVPIARQKYIMFCEEGRLPFRINFLFWLIGYYPLAFLKSQIRNSSIALHTEMAYLTLLASEAVLCFVIVWWSVFTILGIA